MSASLLADLRSDTVTRPSPAMRRAMAEAEVGDACFGDDPTVLRLEATVAERLGKDAAIFVPTGTMSNQIGVAVHTRPGDAALIDAGAHIARWEAAGAAALSGVQLIAIEGPRGLPTTAQLEAARPPDHPKAARLSLLALEDTHNSAGGLAHDARALDERASWAHQRGLGVHLDGARLFNAATFTGDPVERLAARCDTVSLCLSKGLGAPVGSVLSGPRELIALADRFRHRFGGGWRQGGILAAAGLHALEHHTAHLAQDHARAALLAAALLRSGVAAATHPVETNLVCYRVDPDFGTAAEHAARLAARGVLVAATGPDTGRLVTHRDLDDASVAHAATVLADP
ncbi:MAG: threonine aldolase family protein [Deltaproteobacteria bacterium]|nr:threonine aldolase family protein [Deltaproteobacteria bacterium]